MLSTASSQVSLNATSTLTNEPLPTLVFVPTGTTVVGTDKILAFERNFATQTTRLLQSPIEMLNRMETNDGFVEESILKLTHSEPIDWLLPGVKPTEKYVVIPIVSIVRYDSQGNLVFKRVYWDQASILKQLGILPTTMHCKANKSEVTLPVLDARIAKPLVSFVPSQQEQVNLNQERSNTAAGLTSAQANMEHTPKSRKVASVASPMTRILSNDSLNEEQVQFRPSSRVNQKHQSSDIFSSELPPLKTGVSIDPRRYKSQLSLGNLSLADGHEYLAGKKQFSSVSNSSQISLSEQSVRNDGFTRNRSKISDETTQNYGEYHGRKLFPASQVSNETSEVMGEYHGRKLFPGSNDSHFSFGNQEMTAPIARNTQRRDPNARSEEHLLGTRASSRVLKAPGGGSSIHFG